jgi:hypothetical protein
LLLVSPVVVLAIVGACFVARSGDVTARRHASVALAVFACYAVLVAGWSGSDTVEVPGPRYLIPALPFLVIPLAAAWPRARVYAIATALWGGAVMGAALFTDLLLGQNEPVLHAYRERVANRQFAPTIFSMALGRAGIVVYLALVAAAVVGLFRATMRVPPMVQASVGELT